MLIWMGSTKSVSTPGVHFESCEQYCWGQGNEQIMVQLLKLVTDNILILMETWGGGGGGMIFLKQKLVAAA